MNKEEKLEIINHIFSPSAPIENLDLFIGRYEQLSKLKDVINERGQHVVMFGGRGVGKTSLANIVGGIFESIRTTKITCNRTDTFQSIWERAIRKLKFVSSDKKIGFKSVEVEQLIELSLPETLELKPIHLESVFESFPEHLLFIFDEFDSINDKMTKIKMADTIKAFSDNVPNVTIFIIGIAESVTELIGEHPSIERSILQMKMPLMKDEEVDEIINNLKAVNLDIEPDVSKKIITYASGFPHYVHLLCKFAAKNAINSDDTKISSKHLGWAVEKSIENSNYSLRNSFEIATSSSRKKTQFEEVILACSMSQLDDKNSFSPDDVLDKFNAITNKVYKKESLHYNLGMLCKKERGLVLEKTGKHQGARYRFKNPLMKAFIKLKLHNVE